MVHVVIASGAKQSSFSPAVRGTGDCFSAERGISILAMTAGRGALAAVNACLVTSFHVDRIVGCGIMILAVGRNCSVILMSCLEDGV